MTRSKRAGPQRLVEVSEHHRNTVSTRTGGGRLVDLHTDHVDAWDSCEEVRGKRPGSRAEICRRSTGCRQQLGSSTSQVFALSPRHVHAEIDAEQFAAEFLHTRDPGERLTLFTPRDPRLRGLVVSCQREELVRFFVGGDASSHSQPVDHGGMGEAGGHRSSVSERRRCQGSCTQHQARAAPPRPRQESNPQPDG